ncbi:hypothetical protein E3P92_03979 [Wallemia ichthyophaga]|uniref:Glycerophosphocholine acyltransferase 1 n=1 Tax=Wallemia ichthyophaga TaxID=245174 RepID=A0A4T0I124_WALIC|nr:hypothetical protein E3P97_03263 [Wallemia ichthyophaga]TIA94922.1 hypothetical protein E3P95_03986 [Wallemia ichthyophaga]TIA95717.1 hypothetical protein E3P94_03970 [Wallemia ichthyophaga]TIB07735.1 hypothetical protein E3P92_03979 [Wallemia ichthyophaga]TIB22740.1 hypothetical protein E3P88_02903 [Wallemia ichthyophaga]
MSDIGRSNSDYESSDDDITWPSAFTLIDCKVLSIQRHHSNPIKVIDTYVDARIDLIERRLHETSDKLRERATSAKEKAAEIIRSRGSGTRIDESSNEDDGDKKLPAAAARAKDFYEREAAKYKLLLSKRVQNLSTKWKDAKVVQLRDKMSFCFGVFNVLGSALLYALNPTWLHISYTVQILYFLPLRAYTYKQLKYHYFLFDMCYYATILNLAFLWLFSSSEAVFVAAYCMTMGPLAFAVITWRNSLVFHSFDKTTSLFIHMYPPLVFHAIIFDYPNATDRFPALEGIHKLQPGMALLYTSMIYLIWQALYWKYILIERRHKIGEGKGQRTTSFSYMLHHNHGLIGRTLSNIAPKWRESAFMFMQFAYTIVTLLPAVFILYDSKVASGMFLLFIFGVSTWNGASYYVEVFGRRFEKELDALRKELEASSSNGDADDDVSTAKPECEESNGKNPSSKKDS